MSGGEISTQGLGEMAPLQPPKDASPGGRKKNEVATHNLKTCPNPLGGSHSHPDLPSQGAALLPPRRQPGPGVRGLWSEREVATVTRGPSAAGQMARSREGVCAVTL